MGKVLCWFSVLMSFVLVGCYDVVNVASRDTTAPRITDVQVSPSSLIEQGRQVTVSATVTDEGSGVQRVIAVVRYPDGNAEEMAMLSQQAEPNKYSVTFTAQWDGSKIGTDPTQWFVQVIVRAADNAGNQAQSPESRVRAAAAEPPPPPPSF